MNPVFTKKGGAVAASEEPLFTTGCTQQLLGVAVWKTRHPAVELRLISEYHPAVGKIGICASCLNVPLRKCKLFLSTCYFSRLIKGDQKGCINGYCYADSDRRPN